MSTLLLFSLLLFLGVGVSSCQSLAYTAKRLAFLDSTSSPNALSVTWNTGSAMFGQPCVLVKKRVALLPLPRNKNQSASEPLELSDHHQHQDEVEEQEMFCGLSFEVIEPSLNTTLTYLHTVNITLPVLKPSLRDDLNELRADKDRLNGSQVNGASHSYGGSLNSLRRFPALKDGYQQQQEQQLVLFRYAVGSVQDGWSSWQDIKIPTQTYFTNQPATHSAHSAKSSISSNNNLGVKFLVVGDMGLYNAHTLPYLETEVQIGEYSAVLHVGDLAYDLHALHGRRALQFLEQVERVSGRVGYMVTLGNHEAGKFDQGVNFTQYR